jgi:hypothetical protein
MEMPDCVNGMRQPANALFKFVEESGRSWSSGQVAGNLQRAFAHFLTNAFRSPTGGKDI